MFKLSELLQLKFSIKSSLNLGAHLNTKVDIVLIHDLSKETFETSIWSGSKIHLKQSSLNYFDKFIPHQTSFFQAIDKFRISTQSDPSTHPFSWFLLFLTS